MDGSFHFVEHNPTYKTTEDVRTTLKQGIHFRENARQRVRSTTPDTPWDEPSYPTRQPQRTLVTSRQFVGRSSTQQVPSERHGTSVQFEQKLNGTMPGQVPAEAGTSSQFEPKLAGEHTSPENSCQIGTHFSAKEISENPDQIGPNFPAEVVPGTSCQIDTKLPPPVAPVLTADADPKDLAPYGQMINVATPENTANFAATDPPQEPVRRTDAFLAQKRTRRNAADFLLDVTDTVTGTMVQSVSSNDFEGESAKSAGLQSARAGVMAEATAVVETGKTVVYLGKAAVPLVRDMRSGVMDAKQAVAYGRTVVGKQFLRSGGNVLRSTARLGASQVRQFRVESDDFATDTAMTIKDGAGATVHGGQILVRIIRGFAQNLGRSLLLGGIAALVVLSLLLVNAISIVSAAVSTSVLAAHNTEDVGKLVNYLNQYRNEAITEDIYNAFRSERDPNGNPYGYTTLDGKTSNNLQHGVTWNYANGISNDTAEIISMASVYFQQDWPPSSTFSLFDGTFFDYCRMLTAYGLDVTAQESAPYSCLSYGGCVQGWRSEGETVTIQDYMAETHFCHEGTAECGHWVGRRWQWEVGHIEGQRLDRWVPNGSHTVTVYLPVQLPAGAAESELTALPAGAAVIGSSVQAADCYGSLILGDTNLYTGDPDGWFISPGSYSATFDVVTGSGYNAVTDTYTVTFSNATPVAWCPGELQDSRYGHYDLDCTIYMVGCDSYAEPETTEPDGDAGGSGNLQALAATSNGGSLTRTVRKLSQDGASYTTGTTRRYTKTVTLPQPEAGFTGWDADAIEWAELLYKMDWEDLYNVTDGIKCRTVGTRLTDEELAAILQALGLMDGSPRAQVVGFAMACQGRFSYGQPTSLRGSAGAAIVGSNLDCSSFIQYCYWSLGLPFSAKTTANYAGAGDLAEISPSEIQPGDLRVVYASGGAQGHVQMYVGGNAWIECAAGYGVGLNLSNGFMTSRPCHYFSYVGF